MPLYKRHKGSETIETWDKSWGGRVLSNTNTDTDTNLWTMSKTCPLYSMGSAQLELAKVITLP